MLLSYSTMFSNLLLVWYPGHNKGDYLLGSIARIRMRVGESPVYFDLFNNPHLTLPRAGESILVTFSRESVLVLDSSAQQAK